MPLFLYKTIGTVIDIACKITRLQFVCDAMCIYLYNFVYVCHRLMWTFCNNTFWKVSKSERSLISLDIFCRIENASKFWRWAFSFSIWWLVVGYLSSCRFNFDLYARFTMHGAFIWLPIWHKSSLHRLSIFGGLTWIQTTEIGPLMTFHRRLSYHQYRFIIY